jgi:hypothetical protein
MWIDQGRTVVDHPGCFHLQLYKAERAIIEYHQLYRKCELAERQQVAEQHRQPTISGKGDDLPVWIASLHTDGLWQRIRHRAVNKGAEQPALAVHMEVARGPDRRRTHVAGKHCIFCRKLIQNLGDVLRMNRRAARRTHGEIIETLACIVIVAEASIEIGAVGFVLDQRSQHIKRVLHISNQAQIDRGTPSNLVAEPVHLNEMAAFMWAIAKEIPLTA